MTIKIIICDWSAERCVAKFRLKYSMGIDWMRAPEGDRLVLK